MSKVIGWTKHKRFIRVGIPGNCLSELYKVAKGSLQGSIRQHIMYVWNVTISNFSPRLLAVWKLLMRLGETFSHRSILAFHLQQCHSKFVSAGSSTSDFFFPVAHLWFYFSLICWSEAMPEWHSWGLQLVPVQMKTATVVARFPEAETYKLSWSLCWYPLPTTTPKRLSSQLNLVKFV